MARPPREGLWRTLPCRTAWFLLQTPRRAGVGAPCREASRAGLLSGPLLRRRLQGQAHGVHARVSSLTQALIFSVTCLLPRCHCCCLLSTSGTSPLQSSPHMPFLEYSTVWRYRLAVSILAADPPGATSWRSQDLSHLSAGSSPPRGSPVGSHLPSGPTLRTKPNPILEDASRRGGQQSHAAPCPPRN